jgi:hypothetical protein
MSQEIDNMRLEMVRELRDLKNGMQTSMNSLEGSMSQIGKAMSDSVEELKKLNKA